MILNKKTEDYLVYQSIILSNKFTEISNQNFSSLLGKIDDFVKKYPKSQYSYILAKNFLLGLRVSIENNIDLNLAGHQSIVYSLIVTLRKSDYFKNDSIEQKEIIGLSYKIYSLYLLKICIENISRLTAPEEIFTSSLISTICNLDILEMSHQDTPSFKESFSKEGL